MAAPWLDKLPLRSCYDPLRPGTVIVLVSSGIDFVSTPRLYSDNLIVSAMASFDQALIKLILGLFVCNIYEIC